MTATLMDLFKSVTWIEVADALRRIRRGDPIAMKPMERAFHKMLRLKPQPSSAWLQLYWHTLDPDELGNTDTFVAVHCIDTANPYDDGRCDYAIEAVPWAECLGMRVTEDTQNEHAAADIVAISLWELTFFGNDEATIQARLSSFENRDDPNNEEIPAEQALRELGLWKDEN